MYRKYVYIVGGLMIFVGAFLFLYQNPKSNSPPKSTYKEKIIIGTETWPGYWPLYLAQKKGYFTDAGLDVEIRRYVSPGELSRDYVVKKMHGRANITLDAFKEQLEGLDHKIILAIDRSDGSDAIVANNTIGNIADISGKKVGYEAGTLEEYFLIWALSQYDMTLTDIVHIEGDPKNILQSLVNGDIDAAVSHEPFISNLLALSPNFHEIYSTKDAPSLITDVLSFHTDFVKEHPEELTSIVRVYFQALSYGQKNPEEIYTALSEAFDTPREHISKQLEGIFMLSERDNVTAFTFTSSLNSLYTNLRTVHEFMESSASLKDLHDPLNPSLDDTDQLIEPRFIREVTKKLL